MNEQISKKGKEIYVLKPETLFRNEFGDVMKICHSSIFGNEDGSVAANYQIQDLKTKQLYGIKGQSLPQFFKLFQKVSLADILVSNEGLIKEIKKRPEEIQK